MRFVGRATLGTASCRILLVAVWPCLKKAKRRRKFFTKSRFPVISMMLLVHVVATLLYIGCIAANPFYPTHEELNKRFPILPLESWGQQARQNNSLRVLAIGGSNTYGCYVASLDRFLKENISEDSYVLNYGASGRGPKFFIGRQYEFESWEHSKWPNVILMEFSVNMDRATQYEVPQMLDTLFRSIKYKYRAAGFKKMPDFVHLSLFCIRMWFIKNSLQDKTTKARYNTLERLSIKADEWSGFNRGSMTNVWINEFAKFYDIPVVSWADVAFPSAVRHYVSTVDNYTVSPWPFSDEGIHLNKVGEEYVVQNLLGPFFRQAMVPRTEEPYNEFKRYGFDMRMFAPSKVIMNIKVFAVVDKAVPADIKDKNTLKKTVVSPNEHWSYRHILRHENQKSHVCYGSHVAGSVASFHFDVPDECDKARVGECSVSVSLLHSWNVSYTGPTRCTLFKIQSGEALAVKAKGWRTIRSNIRRAVGSPDRMEINSVLIDGRLTAGTLPVSIIISNETYRGSHVLECGNQGKKDQLSCVVDLVIGGSMIL